MPTRHLLDSTLLICGHNSSGNEIQGNGIDAIDQGSVDGSDSSPPHISFRWKGFVMGLIDKDSPTRVEDLRLKLTFLKTTHGPVP